MNLYFRFNDQYVCAPPKCGGTALYCAALGIEPGGRSEYSRALEKTEFVSPEQALQSGLPCVLAVRDPVDRFASLWRDKCRNGDPNLPELSGLSPDELMDLVEQNPLENSHWAPQSAHWLPGIDVVDYLDFPNRIALQTYPLNATRSQPDDADMPVKRIRAHYAADCHQHLKATLRYLRQGLPAYDTPDLAAQWQSDGLAVLERVQELGVFRAMSVGTRQILFQAVRAMRAHTVLDIGTYVGTSALNFALAVGKGGRVVTVDCVDANAPDGFWAVDKRPRSPAQLMQAAGVADRVEFATSTGCQYLATTEQKFDFICIDANKNEEEDWRTVGLALRRLNPNGLIFFDDVFPEGKPVRPGGFAEIGTWNTLQRLQRETGAQVHQINATLQGSQIRCAFVTR